MRKLLLAISAVLSLLSLHSQQPGSLDRSYGSNGTTANAPEEVSYQRMATMPDGKVVVVGTINDDVSYLNFIVGRYTIDGKLDQTFGQVGYIVEKRLNAGIHEAYVALQSDGKILVAGTRTFSGETAEETGHFEDAAVLRYNENGTIDNSFGTGGKVQLDLGTITGEESTNDIGTSVAVQTDGKIIVVVTSAELNDYSSQLLRIVVLNPDGSFNRIDYSSQNSTYQNQRVFASSYTEGGYVVSFLKNADSDAPSVTLYSSRFGERIVEDANSIGGANGHVILKSGKVAVLSAKVSGNYFDNINRITLFNPDGSLDAGFSRDGTTELGRFEPYTITSESNGKLLVYGFGEGYKGFDFYIRRYTASGIIDSTFGTNGAVAAYGGQIIAYNNRLYVLTESNISAYILNSSQRFIKVNLNGNSNPYQNPEWNNWSNLRNRHFNNFRYSDSTASGINAIMSNRNGVNDNGPGYGAGSDSLMAPREVLRHSSYSIGARTITLSGLSPLKTYDMEFYSSRNDHTGNSTIFTIGGIEKSVSTYRNFENKVTFSGLTTDASGNIVISLKSSKSYNYINGFIITENDGNAVSAPAEALASNSVEGVSVELGGKVVEAFSVNVFPNPAPAYFTFRVRSQNNSRVQLRMVDVSGRVVEIKTVAANTEVTLGRTYKQGVYFVEVAQGTERKLVKLVKTN